MPFTNNGNLNLKQVRRVFQAGFLALWFYGFFRTYVAADNILHGRLPADLFLKIDPLAGITSSAAARAFTQELVWWLPLVGLTLVLGRFFCGWICPLGTLLDGSDHAVRLAKKAAGSVPAGLKRNRPESFRKGSPFKYYLLAAGLASAAVSVNLIGLFDPLCIMVRSIGFTVSPLAGRAMEATTGHWLFGYGMDAGHFYRFAGSTGILFAAIFWLNRYRRRFWCRVLCPLGALLGTIGRFTPFRVRVDAQTCTSCHKCTAECKMGALDFPEKGTPVSVCRQAECIQCYQCVHTCPKGSVSIRPGGMEKAAADHEGIDPSRRGVLKGLAAGAAGATLTALDPIPRLTENRHLLRPPFARVKDHEFMDACIRCGMCIRVCPTNTLQPSFLAAGAEGILTPVLRTDIAGCRAGCAACGQVCPTNAIVPFSAAQKLTIKQGTAKLEKGRCICWTENAECNKCVTGCPSQAIKVVTDKGRPKPELVVSAECTGCGMCVEICNGIITNDAALTVTNKGRGVPTDHPAILRNREQKKNAGKHYLPRVSS